MDKSRVEPTIFFIEKIAFSLKLFSGHFYGQSFIKTVRGPLTGSTFPRSVYTSVKKFPRSLSHALEISQYYRVNNKHGGRVELAIVGYLTIYF